MEDFNGILLKFKTIKINALPLVLVIKEQPHTYPLEFLDAISISIVGSVGHSHSHRLFAIYDVQSVIIFEFKVL